MPLLKIKNWPPDPDHAPPSAVGAISPQHPYVRKALQDELNALAQAPVGNRNNTLNQVAFNLGQFIQAGLLTRGNVELLLTQTAQAIGLGDGEIVKTLTSGLEAGMAHPRQTWPDLS
jgi:hypothetical protein